MGLGRFYPVAPDCEWVARLAPLGVETIQLRLKDAPPTEVRRQIADALLVCAVHHVTLVVNDYWQEAIVLRAPFVHLGQEDLAAADVRAIKAADVKLGVSTHDQAELRIALQAEPDYVALGPIYETKLKAMRFRPQGLERIAEWKWCVACPLVVIGGITLERAPGVYAAGADSIAVVTDIVAAPEPEIRVREWLDMAKGPAN